MLVGNKADVVELRRSVKTEDAVEFAEKQGLCFFETSALSGDNVETAFYNLLHQIHTTVVSKRRALLDISTNNIVKPHLIMTSSSTSTITGLKIDDDFEISEMKKISGHLFLLILDHHHHHLSNYLHFSDFSIVLFAYN
ncbi:hypothetical protein ABFX02_02G179800 [Erythranthe guttata]